MQGLFRLLVGIVGVLFFSFCSPNIESSSTENSPPKISQKRVAEAKAYALKNKMDTTVVIFVNFSIHSGKNRLFVYDLNTQKVIKSSLCSHGAGNIETDDTDEVTFSNVPESYCSSKGKYKIGKRGWSNYGTHFNYKLHGLESTNNNAFKRTIVLHSYEYVEDYEIYPEELIHSLGCPMVSIKTMNYLDGTLKKAKQPVLLWIYE